MEQISPINAETVASHVGKPVCVVMRDESCFYGYLGGIKDGKLMLNGTAESTGKLSTNASKAKSQLTKLEQKAGTSAFVPGLGGALAVDLALIALLFLLPFFFI